MTQTLPSLATLRALTDGLDLPLDARVSLLDALLSEPLTHGIRVTLTAGIELLLKAQPEADRLCALYADLEAKLPKQAAFSFIPMSVFVLKLAYVGQWLWPDASLPDRVGNTLRAYLLHMRALPMIQQLYQASDGDYFHYEHVLAQSPNLAYNFGERAFTPGAAGRATLRFSGFSASLGALWMGPMQQGVAAIFDADLAFTFTAEGPTQALLDVVVTRRA